TYGELDRSANQLANHLISLGAGHGHLVCLSVELSTDMAAVLLSAREAPQRFPIGSMSTWTGLPHTRRTS
ncbi:peptide synthetase, partial [Streptomyces cellulosae]